MHLSRNIATSGSPSLSQKDFKGLLANFIDALPDRKSGVKEAASQSVQAATFDPLSFQQAWQATETTPGRNIQSLPVRNGRLFYPSHSKRTTTGFRHTIKSDYHDVALSDRCVVHENTDLIAKLMKIATNQQKLNFITTSIDGMQTALAVPEGDEALLVFHKKVFPEEIAEENNPMHHLHIMASDINNPKSKNPIWVDKNGDVLSEYPDDPEQLLNNGNPVCMTYYDPLTNTVGAVTCGFTYPGGDKKQEKTMLAAYCALNSETTVEEHAGGTLTTGVSLLGKSARVVTSDAKTDFLEKLQHAAGITLTDNRTGQSNQLVMDGDKILVDGEDLNLRLIPGETIDFDLNKGKLIVDGQEQTLQSGKIYLLRDGRTIRSYQSSPSSPAYLVEEDAIFSNLTSDATASGGGKSEMVAGLEQFHKHIQFTDTDLTTIKERVIQITESELADFDITSSSLYDLGQKLRTDGRSEIDANAVRFIWEYKKNAGLDASLAGISEFVENNFVCDSISDPLTDLIQVQSVVSEEKHIFLETNPAFVSPKRLGVQDDISFYKSEQQEDGTVKLYPSNKEKQLFQRLDESILVLIDFDSPKIDLELSPDNLDQSDLLMNDALELFKSNNSFPDIDLDHVRRFIDQDFPDSFDSNYFVNYYPLNKSQTQLLLENQGLKEQLYSDPEIRRFIEDFIEDGAANERIILPFVATSDNVRYLQLGPELETPLEYQIANIKDGLTGNDSKSIDANIAGIRVQKSEEVDFSMAVFNYGHFMPVEVWSLFAMAVPSGKNPSGTEPLSNEGPRTLGPFNILGIDLVMNPWLASRVFSGMPTFLVPSGEIGTTPTGHMAKYILTTAWSFLSEEEKDTEFLIKNGYLEPTPTVVNGTDGTPIEVPEASLLGYRFTEKFVSDFCTRVFSNAEEVLLSDEAIHLLKPETENPEEWIKGVLAIDDYRTKACEEIFESESFNELLPPFRIAVELQLIKGKTAVIEGVQYSLDSSNESAYQNYKNLFTPESFSTCPEYRRMLCSKVYVDFANALEEYSKLEDGVEKDKLLESITEIGNGLNNSEIDKKIGLPGLSVKASYQAVRKIAGLMQEFSEDSEVMDAIYNFSFANASFGNNDTNSSTISSGQH